MRVGAGGGAGAVGWGEGVAEGGVGEGGRAPLVGGGRGRRVAGEVGGG